MTDGSVEGFAYLSPTASGGLYWGELTQGILVRRYKRFLADVELPGEEVVTAHTANTGAMLGCCQPGRPVWLSLHDCAHRKYRYTLEMIDMPAALVGVNTAVPNRLVRAAAVAGAVPEFPHPVTVRSEVKRGESRLDLMLTSPRTEGDVFVEIKNCTLVEDGTAYFPDAVTTRGTRHLEELAALAREGIRAVIFVLVQRGDAVRFSPADHIDPEWGKTLRRVLADGVELLVYRAALTTKEIGIGKRLPAVL